MSPVFATSAGRAAAMCHHQNPRIHAAWSCCSSLPEASLHRAQATKPLRRRGGSARRTSTGKGCRSGLRADGKELPLLGRRAREGEYSVQSPETFTRKDYTCLRRDARIRPTYLSLSCGAAPHAGGSSGAPLAATNEKARRAASASGVTPRRLGSRRRLGRRANERPADSCSEKLGSGYSAGAAGNVSSR